MKHKALSFLMSCFAGSVLYLGLGWIVFDQCLGDYTESHTYQQSGFKKSIDFPFLYLSCLSYSSLISFYLLQSNNTTVKRAFVNTAIIGVLIACMTDFFWYASSNFYSNFLVVCADIIGAAITVGSLGVLNYLLLRKHILSASKNV